MFDAVRLAVLVAAAVVTALQAGLYYGFAISVMPGLARTDGRTFVHAMQQINVAILNPSFFVSFFGAPVLTLTAVALHLPWQQPEVLPWVVAAFVLCVVAFVVTVGVNVPLNNSLAAAEPLNQTAELEATRQRFEATWIRWNVVRALALTTALGCLTWALVLSGRATAMT